MAESFSIRINRIHETLWLIIIKVSVKDYLSNKIISLVIRAEYEGSDIAKKKHITYVSG